MGVFRDILWEIRGLREQLKPVTDYFILLNMMAQQQASSASSLPQGFPGRDVLEAAGITAVADIPTTIRRIERIPGIDENTAMEIARRLSKK